MLTALLATALAADVTTSAVAGLDHPTSQPWAGLQVALHPSQAQGMGGLVRFSGGYAIGDQAPVGFLEGGVTAVVPQAEATIRFGVIGRAMLTTVDYRLPLGGNGPGVIPGGQLLIEFAWPKDPESETLPFRFGVKAGMSSVASGCGVDSSACVSWQPGFVGGVYGRIYLGKLAVEALAGNNFELAVGARW
jgi:hypothetical protein